ncbi:hypothetical protein KJ762_09460 [bacterium]|nr:hypothetical protein [bacterium]MBU1063973.1 hypothetical protein [bacterium]MBU1634720.1 hypothetical protein [bacterium]MBU1874426.1 hypothetical protein [bacterium]
MIRTTAVLSVIFGFLIIIAFVSCPEDLKPEPEIEGDILLSVEDTRCQSVYLNVSIPDSGLRKLYSLYRDYQYIRTDTLYGTDTLIMDSGLQPSTDYLYQALYVYRGDIIDSSDIVYARTMDISNSDFTWYVDTIADYPSVLRDVAIIDDNDIWAVGELKMTGGPYNAIHWDGVEWTYFKIPNFKYPNQTLIGSDDLTSVYAISSSDVYFSTGGTLTRWDGNEFIPLVVFMEYVGDPDYGPLWRMWSESGDDIYLVGQKGYSVHYDGNTWEKLETGTDIFMRDINGKDNHVYATGYNDSGESIALELVDGEWKTLFEADSYYADWDNGEFGRATGLDVLSDTVYILTSIGLIKKPIDSNEMEFTPSSKAGLDLSDYGYTMIGIQALNDIYIGSRQGTVLHYNGVTWKRIPDAPVEDKAFYHGDFKNNTIALIGSFHWDGALIARGVR